MLLQTGNYYKNMRILEKLFSEFWLFSFTDVYFFFFFLKKLEIWEKALKRLNSEKSELYK